MSNKRIRAEIDINAILHNMDEMKKRLKDGTKIMPVIKADGYGHGAVGIAIQLCKLDYVFGFATATAEEALVLKEAGITRPILILGYTFSEDYEKLLDRNVRFTVFKQDMLKELSERAGRLGIKAKVHIKVDTGMSRIGIMPDEKGLEFVKEAYREPNIEVEGIFTHFARADESDKTYAKAQLERFNGFISLIEKNGINIPYKHCSNSAGIIEMPEANMDIVRAGITLYGLWPSDEVDKTLIDLKPAMTLKSSIVYIKELDAGVQISYGGTYTTGRKTRVATIPTGYADGYPRGLSNKGCVLIRGKRAPILGRVCMDQFMVDVTDIPEAKELDEVVLIGRMGNEQISAEELGEKSGRFNYELVCDIAKRVPRIFVEE